MNHKFKYELKMCAKYKFYDYNRAVTYKITFFLVENLSFLMLGYYNERGNRKCITSTLISYI